VKLVGTGGFGGVGARKTVLSKAAAVGVVELEAAEADAVNLAWEYTVTARTCVKFRKDRKVKIRSRGICGSESETIMAVVLLRRSMRYQHPSAV
jgi:hypothetical protein